MCYSLGPDALPAGPIWPNHLAEAMPCITFELAFKAAARGEDLATHAVEGVVPVVTNILGSISKRFSPRAMPLATVELTFVRCALFF